MTSIQDNLRTIRKNIDTAAAGCGRNPEDITLVGVSSVTESDFVFSSTSSAMHC